MSNTRPPDCALGIDLGGTSIKMVGLRTSDGETLLREQLPFQDGNFGYSQIDEDQRHQLPEFALVAQGEVAGFKAQHGYPECKIGVCAPGLAAKDARRIAIMPGRLEGLEGLDWGTALLCPEHQRVPVVNDAHAALLGEIGFGAARGLDDVILLTLGTGVGGAIVSGGRLLRGHIGRAGHLGHITTDFRAPGDICGTPGSLEDAIGFCTLEQRCGGRFKNTTELVQAAESGDAGAQDIWDTSIRALAAGVASLINALDPEAVIIGGGIAKAGAPLFDRLDACLEAFEWRPAGHRVKILPAELGEWAGAYGAAHLAQNPDLLT